MRKPRRSIRRLPDPRRAYSVRRRESDPSPPSRARRAGRRFRAFGRAAPRRSRRLKEYHTDRYNASVAGSARERVLIVGVAPKGVPRPVAEDHLAELERLVDPAGG